MFGLGDSEVLLADSRDDRFLRNVRSVLFWQTIAACQAEIVFGIGTLIYQGNTMLQSMRFANTNLPRADVAFAVLAIPDAKSNARRGWSIVCRARPEFE